MNHRAIRVAALLSSAMSAPLYAQAVPVPPTRELIDENGVDLFRGTFTVDETMASIGGSQGMSLRRIARGSDVFMYNIDALLQSNGNTFYVTVGGRTDRFVKSGSTYSPTEANGAALSFASNIYTYTSRDGTTVTFNKAILPTSGYTPYGNEGLVAAIVSPNGARLDMTYQAKTYCEFYEGDVCTGGTKTARRLASIKDAYGYMANPSYFSDTLDDGSDLLDWYKVSEHRLINLAVDYCQGNVPNCSTPNSWPSTANPNHLVNSYQSSGGVITGVRRPGSTSNDLTITYTNGKVSSVADHSGATNYTYADAAGNRTVTVTNSLSQASVYTFLITSERLTSYKDALNNTTTYTYDASGRLTRITQPEGNYVNYTYDGRGNVTESRAVAKAGSGAADIVSTAAYPGNCSNVKTCNSPTSTTNPRGGVTNYTYDSGHGGVLTITAPAPTVGATRPKKTITYVTQQAQVKNSSGSIVGAGTNITLPATVSQCATLATCAGGADEVKQAVTYGVNGVGNNLLPTQISSGSGNGTLTAITKLAYDNIGNLTSIDGPLAGTEDTTTAVYDGYRRQVGTISPDPDGAGGRPRVAQKRIYATNGDLTHVHVGTTPDATPSGWASFSSFYHRFFLYNADRRPIRTTLWSNGVDYEVIDYLYDTEGKRTCTVQYMNPSSWGPQATACSPLQTNGPTGPDRVTRTLYDANGRPTEQQVAVGISGQEAAEQKRAYNANGTTAHLIDANNNRTTFEYDGHDRLVKTRYPLPAIGSNSSSTTDYEQLTLDAASNVTSRRLRDGQVIGYSYDALSRMTAKDLPGTEPDATYAYDLLSRMTSAVQNGMTTVIGWDALSRKVSETSPQGNVTSQYDLAGRRTRVTLPGAPSLFADYSYDLLGNVTFVRENGATSGVGVLATYQYDSLSRRSSVTLGNGVVQSTTFDPVSRLASRTNDLASTANDLTSTFTYNPASQIASVTRSNDLYAWTGHTNQNDSSTANGLNQITNVGANTVTNDGRGNITAVGSDAFTYSSENFLLTGPNSSALSYDPMGRLYQVTSGTSTTRLGYDGLDRVAEYDGSNAVLRRYVHGVGTDEPLVWYEGSALTTRRFLSSDERGSIISVTDGSGAVVSLNKYDEYGVPQSTNQGSFGYTGQTWLPTLGLYYYKARFYRPDIGRFLQTDPIGYEGGVNLYAYVGNDPVGRSDTFGLRCVMASVGGSPWKWIGCDPQKDVAHAGPDLYFNIQREDIDAVGRSFDRWIDDVLGNVKTFICDSPAVNPGVGADLYAGVGGSVGVGLNIDLSKGRLGLTGNLAIGFGVGIDVGVNMGLSPSGGGIASLNVAEGFGFALPVAPGTNIGASGSYNVLGTDPGWSGASIGRFGSPLAYVNAGANMGINTPSLYDLRCE